MSKRKEQGKEDDDKPCPHPPARLRCGVARDDTARWGKVLWVACCDCGEVIAEREVR